MREPLVDVTGARRRRARARLRRRLAVAGVVAAVLALVGGGVWVVYGSPWLTATQVRVTGGAVLLPEQVEAAASVPLGGPLASVDTAAIEGRVADQLPAVASVRAGRAWPHTVTVEVTEWTPAVVLEVAGQYVWVSGQGRAFHTSAERPAGVMLAQGSLADEEVLLTLARVAADLPETVRGLADHIDASTIDSVTVTLRDGRRVVWGGAGDAELKSSVLVPLLSVQAREYDVSAPTHPTTR